MKNPLRFYKNFNTKIRFPFSLANYGKPLVAQNITRFHSRFKYDENKYIKDDVKEQEKMLNEEKKLYEKFITNVKHIDQYYNISEKRKDVRTSELPERYENFEYFTKFDRMENINDYEIIYRRSLIDTKEEKVLDLKEIPFVTKFHRKTAKLAKISISDDHRYIAFCVDLENNENFTVGIKDTLKNHYFKLKISDCCNMKFAAENKGLYYVTYDEKMRSNAVHVYDFDKKEEKLIFEEKDEQFYVDISVTKDKKYLVISSSTKQTAEVFVVKREIVKEVINDHLKLIFSRKNQSRFFCNHAEDDFYFLTDKDGAYDYKIMKLSDQDFENSKELKLTDFYVPIEGERVKEIDLFKDYIVLYLDKEGMSLLTIINLKDGSNFKVELNEKIAEISPGLNENYISSTFRFHVDTPLVYNRIYEYNILSKQLILLEDFQLVGPKINQASFTSERVHVPSKDGELIPLTILMNKKAKKNRKNKLLLHGYGCYGVSLDIGFNIVNIAALENGWILAFAHVRGGNEKGWKWHKSACDVNKVKSFNDFIDCAEFLIAEGYTHPSLLCAYGASAGGLLVGSVINMRPELFKAVVMNVPFLDVLNTLCDKDLALTASDYEEFGNPLTSSEIYDTIHSYSPYENIVTQEYPFVFITVGEEDFRAPKWAVLKYVKRLRERKKDNSLLELMENKGVIVNCQEGGHQGENGILEHVYMKSVWFGVLDHIILNQSKEIKED